MMHAHWIPQDSGEGFQRTRWYTGVVRDFSFDPPRAVAVTPCLRALNAFRDGLGADGYAQELLEDWRDRLLDEESRDVPMPPREGP